MGEWITRAVAEQCPQATLCLDPFHIVALASDALDEVRREVWNEAQTLRATPPGALPQGLPLGALETTRTTDRAAAAEARDGSRRSTERLFRAYMLKEQLRLVFHEPDTDDAVALLDAWLAWACRCRIPAFVKLAKTITTTGPGSSRPSPTDSRNARVEAINTTLRLITRRAYGFHSADALIALAMLTVGGLRPPLPGRA